MIYVGVRLKGKLEEIINAKSTSMGRSKAEIIREALEHYYFKIEEKEGTP